MQLLKSETKAKTTNQKPKTKPKTDFNPVWQRNDYNPYRRSYQRKGG